MSLFYKNGLHKYIYIKIQTSDFYSEKIFDEINLSNSLLKIMTKFSQIINYYCELTTMFNCSDNIYSNIYYDLCCRYNNNIATKWANTVTLRSNKNSNFNFNKFCEIPLEGINTFDIIASPYVSNDLIKIITRFLSYVDNLQIYRTSKHMRKCLISYFDNGYSVHVFVQHYLLSKELSEIPPQYGEYRIDMMPDDIIKKIFSWIPSTEIVLVDDIFKSSVSYKKKIFFGVVVES
jgi:hypothetical protein